MNDISMDTRARAIADRLMSGGGIHLFKDLGIYKSSLKRKFEAYYSERSGDPEVAEARVLLAERRQVYSLDEADRLSCFMFSAHDNCVTDNPDDYSRVDVWRSEQNILACEAVSDLLQRVRRLVREAEEKRG